jgi:hypothetical protein
MSLNLVSVIHLQFQLNILRVGSHLLRGSLTSRIRKSIKILIK